MTTDFQELINKYYPEGSLRREIYEKHCRAVAALALKLKAMLHEPLPHNDVQTAAMLHDIGIVLTNAPDIDCHGTLPYIAHGYAGADILRREGLPERFAQVCERHTGTGLSTRDIESARLPLPLDRIYMPQSTLEKLICYADKFFSKSGDMKQKTPQQVQHDISRFGTESIDRLNDMINTFGLPPVS